MRIAAFAPDSPFLSSLAHGWLAAGGDPSAGLIILPNRRSARALAGAFLQANQGQALLLPRIIAVGALDEAGLSITENLSLPAAVPALSRQAILAKLILARRGKNGAPTKIVAAWGLAADLADLLDEADLAEIHLADVLPGIVSAELASHWQTTLEFLEIITQAWPAILRDMGSLNPVMRQNLLLDAQCDAWAKSPPAERVWIVMREANPALLRLTKTIATLPDGAVILPGYDPELTELAWDHVDDTHPQRDIASIVAALGARREEVQLWPGQPSQVPRGRTALASKILLPAKAMGEWQNAHPLPADGIYKLTARDEHDEAVAVAMALRDALEVPGQTAALVTPDRGLAMRVSAHLRRFGVLADDSAGEPLKQTPPAVLLRLLAKAMAEAFAPLPLLALLKHPLAANGEAPESCREHARALELSALRGVRPAPGFAGIKFRLAEKGDDQSSRFLDRLELTLRSIIALPVSCRPAEALRALIEAGENLAATDEKTGAERLWSGEAGAALSEILAQVMSAVEILPDIMTDELDVLLDAVLDGHVVRHPRTKDGHPRVAIWGVQEASLQTVDFVVLGGLVEGVWPVGSDPGPWMSRPMRKTAGLPLKECDIARAANDFFNLCCQTKTLVFSAPKHRGRAPAVPARWLTRFDAFLEGHDLKLQMHPAASWSQQIDLPQTRLFRPKPMPRPPVHVRPHTLSITDIATLISDPYAIYLSKILKIRKLDSLDEESDAGQFGNIVHAGLAAYFAGKPDFSAPGAVDELNNALQISMRKTRPRAALQHWWDARLQRIARWVVETERERRSIFGDPPLLSLELSGNLTVAEKFTLTGRADRIERRVDGSVFIVDYKTGTAPDTKSVLSGRAPQLPLEAMMAQAGAFGEAFTRPVNEIAVWKLSGGRIEGNETSFFDDPADLRQLVERVAAQLPVLFGKFAALNTPYLASPHPDRQFSHDNFEGISRRAEWIDGADAIAS